MAKTRLIMGLSAFLLGLLSAWSSPCGSIACILVVVIVSTGTTVEVAAGTVLLIRSVALILVLLFKRCKSSNQFFSLVFYRFVWFYVYITRT